MCSLTVSRLLRLTLLLWATAFAGCSTLQPAPIVLPHPQPPAVLMQSESSEDYSQRVQLWLQKVRAALEELYPSSTASSPSTGR